MKLKGVFTDHFASVESEQVFVPFIGGEAERIERCAVAAKRCLGVDSLQRSPAGKPDYNLLRGIALDAVSSHPEQHEVST